MAMYSPQGMEAHPYDQPWAIVQGLRKDVADLRAMLHAEQQQRAAEVQELKGEVAMLREALKTETHPLHAITHKLSTDLDATASHFSKAIEEVKASHRQNLGHLNSLLQDEIRTRKHAEDLRDSREASRDSEWKSTINHLQSEMGHQKQVFLSFKDESVNDVNNLVHDVELIMNGLVKVSHAKETIATQNLFCTDTSGGCNLFGDTIKPSR
mmetsp:Transcript_49345/g.104973  ORF Transcript_49345/g.104973 Transcript_49345/m.104973 type:complete len:211 (+) Transcript_49345:189-821(+)